MKNLSLVLALALTSSLFADVLPERGYQYTIKVHQTLSALLMNTVNFTETRTENMRDKNNRQCEVEVSTTAIEATKESIVCRSKEDCSRPFGKQVPACEIKAFNERGNIQNVVTITSVTPVKLRD